MRIMLLVQLILIFSGCERSESLIGKNHQKNSEYYVYELNKNDLKLNKVEEYERNGISYKIIEDDSNIKEKQIEIRGLNFNIYDYYLEVKDLKTNVVLQKIDFTRFNETIISIQEDDTIFKGSVMIHFAPRIDSDRKYDGYKYFVIQSDGRLSEQFSFFNHIGGQDSFSITFKKMRLENTYLEVWYDFNEKNGLPFGTKGNIMLKYIFDPKLLSLKFDSYWENLETISEQDYIQSNKFQENLSVNNIQGWHKIEIGMEKIQKFFGPDISTRNIWYEN